MARKRSRPTTSSGSGTRIAAPAAGRSALLQELDVHREELATQNENLRQANAALAAVKERYAQLYDTAPIAYFTVDVDGRIIEANLTAAELLDTERSFLFGRTFDDLVAPSSRASFREFRRRVLDTGGRPTHETVFALEKRRFPAHITASAFRSGGSPSNECLLGVTDETERRRLEDERRALATRVAEAQRVESLGVLAGGIAHDFNNILSIALASADLALLDEVSAARTRDALQEIRTAVVRAADLSTQMLAYTGHGYRKSEPLDVSEVVRSMNALLLSSAPKGSLVLDLAEGLPLVVGETEQVQQIVLNLVVNAAEAVTPLNGRILVRTRHDSAADSVVLEVADNGVGMDDLTRHRAFDPFFSTKFVGRGLGLAVVHGHVRAHGGTVTIDSRPHAGATFRVRLPADASPSRPAAANDLSAEITWRGEGLVLVVDDEGYVRSAMGRLLAHVGFDVCYAPDGLEALKIAQRPPSALVAVVLDLTMPRLDGAATLTQLKTLDRTLPVVLMSGYSSAHVDRRAMALADGFLPKPFTLGRVVEVIRSALEGGARARAT